MTTTIHRYRQRVKQEWPRLIVAFVSLYGIYYAADTIRTTTDQFKALGALNARQEEAITGQSSSSPITFGSPQIMFNDYSQNDLLIHDPTPRHVTLTSNIKSGHNERSSNSSSNHAIPPRPGRTLLNQIRILQSATNLELDFEGQTEAAAIYTLLVISSLSIVDNLIGIMVATRRSLRLTQVAFAIWCLRFLFRTLSLISVGFMLAVSSEFRRSYLPGVAATFPPQLQQTNSTNIDVSGGPGLDFGSGGERKQPTMYTITVLEIIVAIVHGWSLLVLIRDLRNQPRPRTVVVRVWAWFCGTSFGGRLGLSRYNYNTAYLGVAGGGGGGGGGGGNGGGYRGGERYVGVGAGEGSVWDREIAASLGLNSGLLSSGSSIRSVTISVPEMGVVPGRSRASSISSFSSAEKL